MSGCAVTMNSMNVYEPFAGVGGIGRGLEMIGWKTVAYSEFDPKIAAKRRGRQYAAEVMGKHYPHAVSTGDVSTLTFATNKSGEQGILRSLRREGDVKDVGFATIFKGVINIIAGGFPCQDISLAGKQKGIEEGTRSGLWRHFFQSIQGLRPDGVIIENVAALAGKGLDRVLRDLASIGYDCEWDVIAAAGVGAPHLRERMFIIAWPHGSGHHGQWPTPPVWDWWAHEPEGVPRLVGDLPNRPARLRCLGNAVVPQVAAHVGGILATRISGDNHDNSGMEQWDTKHKSGDLKGEIKQLGWSPTPGTSPELEPFIPAKLPRAGRMTQGCIVERVRSCTQAHAKKIGLANMAPTLRPRVAGAPDLMPTPAASNPNDGENPATWLERRELLKDKGINGNGAGMPLGIAAQLVPTPTAKDADSSRNESAIRSDGAAFKPGRTLTDFADPSNGGRIDLDEAVAAAQSDTRQRFIEQYGDGMLLPTPRAEKIGGYASEGYRPTLNQVVQEALLPSPAAADGERASDAYMRGNPTLQGAARLLPTPVAGDHRTGMAERYGPGERRSNLNDATVRLEAEQRLLPTPKASDGDKGVRSFEGAQREMARGKGGDLDAAAKLLPTPRPCSGLRSSGMNRTEMMDALGDTVGADVHRAQIAAIHAQCAAQASGGLLPTPTANEHTGPGHATKGGMNLRTAVHMIPTPRASDSKGVGPLGSKSHEHMLEKQYLGATMQEAEQRTGKLNPEWVEWLMGFPIGWTELD